MDSNMYMPKLAEITKITEQTSGPRAIKTFRTRYLDHVDVSPHRCGQCAMLSVFGIGEAMISISSSPLVKDYLEFSILKSGRVTCALHEMHAGDVIGLRSPLGNSFPVDEWKGRNILFVGGGIGIAPIWSVLQTTLMQKDQYGDLSLFYGAASSNGLIYKEELQGLKARMGVHLTLYTEEPGWDSYIGYLPTMLMEEKPSPANTIALTCGSHTTIRRVIECLGSLGFQDEQIYTTVENKMKCGVGKCGRCNIGKYYVCKDGPVFSWAKLKQLPQEY